MVLNWAPGRTVSDVIERASCSNEVKGLFVHKAREADSLNYPDKGVESKDTYGLMRTIGPVASKQCRVREGFHGHSPYFSCIRSISQVY